MVGNSNDNRENNKGCLEGLLEIFLEGLLAMFVEIFGALLEWLVKGAVKAIGFIIAVGLVIYLIVTFIANHT